jgi:hypothetical protein
VLKPLAAGANTCISNLHNLSFLDKLKTQHRETSEKEKKWLSERKMIINAALILEKKTNKALNDVIELQGNLESSIHDKKKIVDTAMILEGVSNLQKL